MRVPDDSATASSVYLWEIKTCMHTKICTQVFTAPLFVTDRNWTHPRRPATGEGAQTVVAPDQGLPGSTKHEISINSTAGRNLQGMMLSEKSQSQKLILYVIFTICNTFKWEIGEMEGRSVVARGGAGEVGAGLEGAWSEANRRNPVLLKQLSVLTWL